MNEPKVGDWVRFYSGGVLKIAIVQYVEPSKIWGATYDLLTDAGRIDDTSVIELRRAQEKP
jgi:hypothetical protein